LYNASTASSERWRIPAAAIAVLTAVRTLWIAALTAYNNPATRTQAVIQTKNNVQRDYTSKLRAFVRSHLINNPDVTDADKLHMNLPIHDSTQTPAPVPTVRPSLNIDFSQIGRHTVNARSEGSNSVARPKGVVGFELRARIGNATEPNIEDMQLICVSMRSSYIVEYASSNRGKFVWYVARWVNTRDEKGPWSEMIGALIN
jgi:hypothetical protein